MPPAGNGTIRVTGWLGHACAEETHGDSNSTAAAKAMIGKLEHDSNLVWRRP